MATLKDELASLKIYHNARAGGCRGGLLVFVLLIVISGATVGWFYSQRAQAASSPTASLHRRLSHRRTADSKRPTVERYAAVRVTIASSSGQVPSCMASPSRLQRAS